MSDTEISTFKVENEKTILWASKLVWDEGLMPHRIVLCAIDQPSLGEKEYVTYQENLVFHAGDFNGFKHRDFYWGHYFGANQKKAHEDYLERVKGL